MHRCYYKISHAILYKVLLLLDRFTITVFKQLKKFSSYRNQRSSTSDQFKIEENLLFLKSQVKLGIYNNSGD